MQIHFNGNTMHISKASKAWSREYYMSKYCFVKKKKDSGEEKKRWKKAITEEMKGRVNVQSVECVSYSQSWVSVLFRLWFSLSVCLSLHPSVYSFRSLLLTFPFVSHYFVSHFSFSLLIFISYSLFHPLFIKLSLQVSCILCAFFLFLSPFFSFSSLFSPPDFSFSPSPLNRCCSPFPWWTPGCAHGARCLSTPWAATPACARWTWAATTWRTSGPRCWAKPCRSTPLSGEGPDYEEEEETDR